MSDSLEILRAEELRPLKPLLAELCGGEEAEKIEKALYGPNAILIPNRAVRICERLLSYPVRIAPEWFADRWFLLFSLYADPIRILDELDARFQPEHVMEVFMSRDDWSSIGYGLGGGLVPKMWENPRYADEAFAEAEKKFTAFLLTNR